MQQAINKARKEQELQEQKVERERKREEKQKEMAAKKAAREAEKEQKAVSKQLLLEAKTSKKRAPHKKKQTSQLEPTISFTKPVAECEVGKSTKTRSGRKTRVPQRFLDKSE